MRSQKNALELVGRLEVATRTFELMTAIYTRVARAAAVTPINCRPALPRRQSLKTLRIIHEAMKKPAGAGGNPV